MFESIINFFKNVWKSQNEQLKSKDAAKERLQLVLMQDRANVSADYLDLMKQEIIEVIKKYIDVDENAIDVRLTNTANEDGTTGAPALYANIPIVSVKEDVRNIMATKKEQDNKQEENKEKKQEEEKVTKEVNKENEEKQQSEKNIENKKETEESKEEETKKVSDSNKKEEKQEEKHNEIKENKNQENVESKKQEVKK